MRTVISRARGCLPFLAAGALLGTGCSGSNGAPGPAGSNGSSCTVSPADGGAVVTCTDGTSVKVPNGVNGLNGMNGLNGAGAPDAGACTVVKNGDAGTYTLSCGGDAGAVTVLPAIADYATMTSDEKAAAQISAVITNLSFPADGRPVISMKVTERHGYGVKNLSPTAVSWRFALLKLVPGLVTTTGGVNGSANDTWVSYMAANDHTAASSETAMAANLTDHGDGTYDYRMAKVINGGPTTAGTTYDPAATHRLIVLLYASGNPFPPINLVKDFVPATGADVTGQVDKVDGKACLECHTSFRAIIGGTGAFGSGEFHSGVRYDIRTCVACHNDQRRFDSSGNTLAEPAMASDGTWTGNAAVLNREAVLDFPVFIHKIHMGTKLTLTGGTYQGVPQPYETTYPQDIRNCAKCHRAPAPLADNWETKPSVRACGACHDDVSFEATPPPGRKVHPGGPQPNDAGCATCHRPGGPGGDTAAWHTPVSPPDPHNVYADATTAGNANTNAAYVAAAGAVPKGASVIAYVVQSVSTWTDTAAGGVLRPQIAFKIQRDGKDVVFPDPATATELIPGFVGSPSAYFVFAVPQDGIAAPADFNASASAYIRNVWNHTGTCSNAASTTTRTGAGNLSGPDANGFYTLQLTCAIVPANATMLTGGIGYTYALGSRQSPSNPDLDFVNNTQPLTEIDLPAYPYTPNLKADGVTPGYGGVGGLIVPALDVSMVATGYTARRAIVDNTRCSTCHVSLGVGPDFHAGQRNDAKTCNWCHRPNQTSSGWSANQKDFIHAIHGAAERTTDFNWHEESPTEGFWKTTYPGVLNDCEMCHLPGTYDFSSTATTSAYPNMLPSTVGQGTYATGSVHSPYVAEATSYGAGFSYNALTGATTSADPTTLVESPFVAACVACHDSPTAVDHMQTNGGSFYEPRSTAFTKPQKEECLLCHGPGAVASISALHTFMP
jgi:OmcA/MtrC family decaheme c-type cytochrome